MKKGIFISYRREDTEGFARSLYQSLESTFGREHIFMDVDNIAPGLDFVDAIGDSLKSCGVLLVLIGDQWLDCKEEDGSRRIDNPEDFVRLEVATALARGILVIPVLIRGTEVPKSSEMPEDLQALSRKQALKLRHSDWKADIEKVQQTIRLALRLKPKKKETGNRWGYLAIAAATFLALGVLGIIDDYLNPETKPEMHTLTDNTQKNKTASATPHANNSNSPESHLNNPAMVAEVQTLLSQLGYETGIADGQIGPVTRAAIKDFQRNQGLPASGELNSELIERLSTKSDSKTTNDKASTNTSLSSRWKDSSGIDVLIQQSGNTFTSQSRDPITGASLYYATGTLSGKTINYTYVESSGSFGVGRATVNSANSISYTAVNSLTGVRQSGTLSRVD